MEVINRTQASNLVGKPKNRNQVLQANGITDDIIRAVIAQYNQNKEQTATLAKQLKRSTTVETCKAVWEFVRTQVPYVLDPVGVQYIPTPARILADAKSDCKGYSILINSLLFNLGIKSQFRFASYSANKQVTHVYAVAFDKGQEIIIDACLPTFNEEKPYTNKRDFMTKIIAISGIAGSYSNDINISGFEDDTLLSMKIARQTSILDKYQTLGVHGIGAVSRSHDMDISLYDRGIAAYTNWDEKAMFNAAQKAYSLGRVSIGNIFKKAWGGIKKGARAYVRAVRKIATTALKVLTAPMRLAFKGILEIMLPKAAPFFLYLFITNETTIKNLPISLQRKRKKAASIAKFITGTIGMREGHFMQIVRNGIRKKMGDTPENILMRSVKGAISGTSSGVGIVPLVAMALASPQVREGLMGIINKIISIFGKKPDPEETPTPSDTPKPEEEMGEANPKAARMLQASLATKPNAELGLESDDKEYAAEKKQMEQTIKNIQAEPKNTPVDAKLPIAPLKLGGSGSGGSGFSISTPLLIGLGAVGFLALNTRKSR